MRTERGTTRVVSRRRDIAFEWSLAPGRRVGLTRVHVRLDCPGTIERVVATGRFWIFAAVVRESGRTEAFARGAWHALPAPRAFLVPPRSLVRLRLTAVSLDAVGLCSVHRLGPDLERSPSVARLVGAPPEDADGIQAALGRAQVFDPDEGASGIAVAARRELLAALSSRRPVAEVARALGYAPDTVSRHFRTAYGVGPKAYVQAVRVSDASIALLSGEKVIASGLGAGFSDAARYYSAFRAVTRTTPGRYASLHDRKTRRSGARSDPG